MLPNMPGSEVVAPATYFMDKIISYHVYLQILHVAKIAGLVILGIVVVYVLYKLYQGGMKKRN